MKTAGTSTGTRIALKNILYLTDFSEASQAALPFAVAMAREFGGTIHALHVMMPEALTYMSPDTIGIAIEAQEEAADAGMRRVGAQLNGAAHDVSVMRAASVWQAVEQAIADCETDLIVLGTQGRTGVPKLLMGSIAEEIFRRSPVPVLTIGPWARGGAHNAAQFHRVLFATDFSAEAVAASGYAISLAEEHAARLILLNVIHERVPDSDAGRVQTSVAHVMYELHEIVPQNAELWCRPEAVVEHGDPAARILEVARLRGADLIVLGVRSAAGSLGAATHLERAVAHKVVAHAACPVLTVRG
jgi:nucleotide-binding universal stress UspA family protein